ncbi:MAG TPA: chromate resistance protein ChrB domain-containing protein [Candidatus Bathyarchaeia archaeon]|nr:chromate resistance protein ChrB domain-containing protein [Candidatus Bathyarchaeia archaeon]
MDAPDEQPWLLLIHQLPPKPSYLRVKVWRRLQSLGAVAIKNSVYVLPSNDQTREDFEWVLREIVKEGGEASMCEARFVEGLRDEQIEMLFHGARDADYAQLAEEVRELAENLPGGRSRVPESERAAFELTLARYKRRLAEIVEIDFFSSSGREVASGLLAGVEARLGLGSSKGAELPAARIKDLQRRVWVTRKGVHIDRIASAWLIRRFIDPHAQLKFVAGKGYEPARGEVRFDMFDAEFTHEGDLCTFEVLLSRLGIEDPALRPIAEIVHDIDLKDGKFRQAAAPGIDRLIAGIAMGHAQDEERVARGSAVFEDLYEYFRRKRS